MHAHFSQPGRVATALAPREQSERGVTRVYKTELRQQRNSDGLGHIPGCQFANRQFTYRTKKMPWKSFRKNIM